MDQPTPDTAEVHGPERAELCLPDGTVLVADVWRPVGLGPCPVLLMRQPYGRAIASTVVLAHPAWYAARGYIVVIQDVRGCGDSGGDFQPFVHDMADGAATLDWASNLPGSNGKLGLYGFSFQAITQYLAIAGGGRRPDAIAPIMGSWRPRQDWAYDGNAFRRELCAVWALQMAVLKAKHLNDGAAVASLSALEGLTAIETALRARPDLSHYGLWESDSADYWSSISPGDLLGPETLNIPALHIGGWNDYMLGGTLAAHAAFRAAGNRAAHLVIGPWSHIPWSHLAGAADVGAAADLSVDRTQLAFFDFYLKGLGAPPGPVQCFDMGRRDWRQFDEFPVSTGRAWSLASGGLAAARGTDGRLVDVAGPAGDDWFVSDPTRPAPLIGGAVGAPLGFVDRSAADGRADVAVYTSAPFTAGTSIAGPVAVDLNVEVDADPADIVATLSLVTPEGAALVLATGITRTAGTGRRAVTIDLRAICVTIEAGGALRLSLQGAAAPAFQLPLATRPTTYRIRHGGASASRLRLSPAPEDQTNGH